MTYTEINNMQIYIYLSYIYIHMNEDERGFVLKDDIKSMAEVPASADVPLVELQTVQAEPLRGSRADWARFNVVTQITWLSAGWLLGLQFFGFL